PGAGTSVEHSLGANRRTCSTLHSANSLTQCDLMSHLYSPVLAYVGVQVGWAGSVGGGAGDRESDFFTDRLAVEGEDVAADAGDLLGVGKFDTGRHGPRGPAVGPAVAAFFNEVVGFAGQQRHALVPYFFLQSRAVPFDSHDVVETAFTGDVPGGFVLRVRGVQGDDHPLRSALVHGDVVEEVLDLGDLVRAVGHPDLGDRHRRPVDHRGEQGDLVVGLG